MAQLPRRRFMLSAAALGLGSALPTRSEVAVENQTAAAEGVLKRFLGKDAARVRLKLAAPGTAPWYAAATRGASVTITGNSAVALTHGAYSYLKSAGAAHMSWEGDRVALPAHLPAANGAKIATPFAHRVYMNTCTFGYTTPFWDWARWARELDWMALHGIDMPLAMEGQEYVWQALWRELGLSNAELGDYFSGPAFTPWQRMGNIEGYLAPLPQAWIDKKRTLQTQILARMTELGMTPILPAFGGYVPKAFAQKHPKARIYPMRPWEGFHETYWLDPADPLFAKIAARFIALYSETYGEGRYYLADSFNEMLPPISTDVNSAPYGDATANTKETETVVDPAVKAVRLAAYGKAIYDSIRQARPDAVWVMQGWLFGADKHFWTPDAIGAFLKDVPQDRLMILDIGNDRYPGVWQSSAAFQGKPWIYGYVHNYGGSNPVYGDLGFYREDIRGLIARKDKGDLKGFGLFPEGLHNNSIVYEYAYDLAWGQTEQPLDDWLHTYLKSRYGQVTPALMAAWKTYVEAVFTTRYWTPRWWRSQAGAYLFCKRPTVDMIAFEGHPGDRQKLREAVTAFLSFKDLEGSALYRHDVIDAVGHLVSQEIDDRLMAALKAYMAGDVNGGDALRDQITGLAMSLDGLLGAQPDTLATWIDAARAYGDTPAEKAYYELNAKAQATVWGGKGNLNDYASKAWQGLYKDFYLPRWTKLFTALRQAATSGKAFDQAAFTRDLIGWEQGWIKADIAFERHVPPQPLNVARALMAQLDVNP